jgi:hypothetical protein
LKDFEIKNQSEMNKVSTSIKVVVSLVVVATLVATRFSSSINVSEEWIDRRKEAGMTLLSALMIMSALLFVVYLYAFL